MLESSQRPGVPERRKVDAADVPENTVAATENLQDRRSRAAEVWRKGLEFRLLEVNPKTKKMSECCFGCSKRGCMFFQMTWNVLT